MSRSGQYKGKEKLGAKMLEESKSPSLPIPNLPSKLRLTGRSSIKPTRNPNADNDPTSQTFARLRQFACVSPSPSRKLDATKPSRLTRTATCLTKRIRAAQNLLNRNYLTTTLPIFNHTEPQGSHIPQLTVAKLRPPHDILAAPSIHPSIHPTLLRAALCVLLPASRLALCIIVALQYNRGNALDFSRKFSRQLTLPRKFTTSFALPLVRHTHQGTLPRRPQTGQHGNARPALSSIMIGARLSIADTYDTEILLEPHPDGSFVDTIPWPTYPITAASPDHFRQYFQRRSSSIQ